MRGRQEQAAKKQQQGFLLRLSVLALLFLAGVILGQVLSGRVPASTAQELERYLSGYVSLDRAQTMDRKLVLSTLLIYFRYPVLAFLLGFSSIGVLLLPVLSAVYGFFLSFSVCCFTASFGGEGVLLALAVFGLRCVVTLPCYFALAVPSLGHAVSLAALSFGNGRRVQPVHYGIPWWTRLGIVTAILLLGVLAALLLGPAFVDLALKSVLF
jgi:stage II sporulation protein M